MNQTALLPHRKNDLPELACVCAKQLEKNRHLILTVVNQHLPKSKRHQKLNNDALQTAASEFRAIEVANRQVIRRLQQMKRFRDVIEDALPQFDAEEHQFF